MSKTLAFGLGAAVLACFAMPDFTWAQIASCRASSAGYAHLSFDQRMEVALGTFGRNVTHPQDEDFLRFARDTGCTKATSAVLLHANGRAKRGNQSIKAVY